jgi:hypothetical protein
MTSSKGRRMKRKLKLEEKQLQLMMTSQILKERMNMDHLDFIAGFYYRKVIEKYLKHSSLNQQLVGNTHLKMLHIILLKAFSTTRTSGLTLILAEALMR